MAEVWQGKVWVVGDDLDTDNIIGARYLQLPDLKQMATHTLELVLPDFASGVRPGDFVVAGENFGMGSSREHAVHVLKTLGVRALLAESFARVFFRNALNTGLPCLECPGIRTAVQPEDQLSVNPAAQTVEVERTGQRLSLPPVGDIVLELMTAGGLVPYLRKRHASA